MDEQERLGIIDIPAFTRDHCIYVFYSCRTLHYVGQTQGLLTRTNAHAWEAGFDKADRLLYFYLPYELALILEARLILKFKPSLNRQWRRTEGLSVLKRLADTPGDDTRCYELLRYFLAHFDHPTPTE